MGPSPIVPVHALGAAAASLRTFVVRPPPIPRAALSRRSYDRGASFGAEKIIACPMRKVTLDLQPMMIDSRELLTIQHAYAVASAASYCALAARRPPSSEL
jgi:hypothetical protein